MRTPTSMCMGLHVGTSTGPTPHAHTHPRRRCHVRGSLRQQCRRRPQVPALTGDVQGRVAGVVLGLGAGSRRQQQRHRRQPPRPRGGVQRRAAGLW
mgnify:CR=1 FL=1